MGFLAARMGRFVESGDFAQAITEVLPEVLKKKEAIMLGYSPKDDSELREFLLDRTFGSETGVVGANLYTYENYEIHLVDTGIENELLGRAIVEGIVGHKKGVLIFMQINKKFIKNLVSGMAKQSDGDAVMKDMISKLESIKNKSENTGFKPPKNPNKTVH